jgi:hypothetical protein
MPEVLEVHSHSGGGHDEHAHEEHSAEEDDHDVRSLLCSTPLSTTKRIALTLSPPHASRTRAISSRWRWCWSAFSFSSLSKRCCFSCLARRVRASPLPTACTVGVKYHH